MLWDRNGLRGWQVGLVTFTVFVVGLFLIYGAVFLFHLIYAPYRQRNEARNMIKELTIAVPRMTPIQAGNDILLSIENVGEHIASFSAEMRSLRYFSQEKEILPVQKELSVYELRWREKQTVEMPNWHALPTGKKGYLLLARLGGTVLYHEARPEFGAEVVFFKLNSNEDLTLRPPADLGSCIECEVAVYSKSTMPERPVATLRLCISGERQPNGMPQWKELTGGTP